MWKVNFLGHLPVISVSFLQVILAHYVNPTKILSMTEHSHTVL